MLEALAISLESGMQGIVFVVRAGSVIEALSRKQKVHKNHVQGSVRLGFKLAFAAQAAMRASSRLTSGMKKAGGAPQWCGSASDRLDR